MVKVKICGITNLEDGFAAISHGADYLGFVVDVQGAERSIDRKEAVEFFEQLHGSVPLVALTDLTKGKDIAALCKSLGADAVQLLAELPEEEIFEFRCLLPKTRIFKVIRVKSRKQMAEAKKFEKFVDFIVLDSASGKRLGGTGKKADWKECNEIRKNARRPVFLAGGLTAENVAAAIRQVKPFGVDVSSGVKMQSNKRKIDLNRLKNFIEKAKK